MGDQPGLERFFQIRAKKQKHILNAAFTVFGKQGYRKASIADIAKEAGTTKGMITYYFGSKKNLYLYLVELVQSGSLQVVREQLDSADKDFFEKIKAITEVQLAAMKEYPAIINFANSVYYEKDPEVAEELEQIINRGEAAANRLLEEGTDLSRIKPGFDLKLIHKLFIWANIGFMEELCGPGGSDKADELIDQFYRCLDMMKQVFYK